MSIDLKNNCRARLETDVGGSFPINVIDGIGVTSLSNRIDGTALSEGVDWDLKPGSL